MEPSLSYNQYRLISAPGEPQKLELASQVEIQKLRIQVEQTNVLSFFRFFFNFTTVLNPNPCIIFPNLFPVTCASN